MRILKVILSFVLALGLSVSMPQTSQADAIYCSVDEESRTIWVWELQNDDMDEARIFLIPDGVDFPSNCEGYNTLGSGVEQVEDWVNNFFALDDSDSDIGDKVNELTINDDAFDGLGEFRVNKTDDTDDSVDTGIYNDDIDTNPSPGDFVSNTFTDDDTHNGGVTSSVTYTFTKNYWLAEASVSEVIDSIEFEGDLGSDGSTTFVQVGEAIFSHDQGNGDPVIRWVTDGEFPDGRFDDSTDSVSIIKDNSDSMFVKLYLYAYVWNEANQEEYGDWDSFFDALVDWANEDLERMDIFGYEPPAPEENVPLIIMPTERRTKNLTYAESKFGSDMLSDPDGRLRALVNEIEEKFGALISIKPSQ